jgi:hypothetical protein
MQSIHWHSYQVTILVHITWLRNLNFGLHDETSNVIMKYHFYTSNDKSHDSYFVQHSLLLHCQKMCWMEASIPKTTGFGQTCVFISLRAKPHGFLLLGIVT